MKLTDNPEISGKIFLNRNAYFIRNNIDPAKVISAEIVHGNSARVIYNNNGGKVVRNVDGLITQSKGIFLSITSADCLPIFLFDPESSIISMVHAGWRSLADNILQNSISKFTGNFKSNPKKILAGIGPSICQKHYGVSPEVAEKFKNYPKVTKEENGEILLDLKKIAQLQLAEAGLSEKNIEISPECTFEFPEKYFSARRERKKISPGLISLGPKQKR